MLDTLVAAFRDYPVLTLFVVIGLGYVAGEIRILGFRFGVAGVLFIGLAVGALDPTVALPEIVSTLGLIIFVYAIGIQSGPQFFESLRRDGYRNTVLAVAALAAGAIVTAAAAYAFRIPAARAAGLFCGALTNTPALAAVRELGRGSNDPVVGYSIAYPIGVIGVLVCFQFLRRLWKAGFTPPQEGTEIQVKDFVIRNPAIVNRTVSEILRYHKDPGFVISRIQQQGETRIVRSDTRLQEGDVVAVVGDEEALLLAEQIFGAASDTRIELDRSRLDYRRVFVSSKEVVGKRIRDLELQDRMNATITRLRRGDIDVVPDPETRLEFGDRIRVLTERSNFPAIAKYFGDSIRGTAETDFGSVAIGMVLGVMAGLMPLPLPGGTTLRLGLAGGPLLVALVLGKLERSGRITWVMPVSANLTLRQIGLLLFLAAVGTRAGFAFRQTLSSQGLPLLAAGAAVTFAVTLITMIAGHKLLRMPYDTLMGVMSGVQTQPACLAYAENMARTDQPNVGYASVYPAAMIAKIILAQLLVTTLR